MFIHFIINNSFNTTFLIKCDHDASHTIVADEHVTFDENNTAPGTKVSFLFRKKKYEGVIELYSGKIKTELFVNIRFIFYRCLILYEFGPNFMSSVKI